MNLRKLISTGAVVAGLAILPLTSAHAQDISDSHLAAARDAISAIGATDRFDNILPGVAVAIKQQLIANNPDLEEAINEVVDSETIALVPRRADLEVEAATAYAKAIAEEDLKAIAEFYKSDAGKSLLQNGVIVSREIQQAAGVWQRGIERDLLESVNAKLKEVAPRADVNTTDDAAASATEDAPAATDGTAPATTDEAAPTTQ